MTCIFTITQMFSMSAVLSSILKVQSEDTGCPSSIWKVHSEDTGCPSSIWKVQSEDTRCQVQYEKFRIYKF